jgi:hypothetical protein
MKHLPHPKRCPRKMVSLSWDKSRRIILGFDFVIIPEQHAIIYMFRSSITYSVRTSGSGPLLLFDILITALYIKFIWILP